VGIVFYPLHRILTKVHAQVGYPPRSDKLLGLFSALFSDFDAAMAAFSQSLGCLFEEVAETLEKSSFLTDRKAWRDWLEEKEEMTDGGVRRRDVVYDNAWATFKLQVCGHFCARVLSRLIN